MAFPTNLQQPSGLCLCEQTTSHISAKKAFDTPTARKDFTVTERVAVASAVAEEMGEAPCIACLHAISMSSD